MSLILQITFWLIVGFAIFYKFVFLRDNKNQIPAGNNIVSPASGKIINIQKIKPQTVKLEISKGFFGRIKTDFPKNEEYWLVNIFMSPFNVHFTKAPCFGEIVEIIRRPGKFLAVQNVSNGLENEKQEFILKTDFGIIKVIQIAGFLARRCVSLVNVGSTIDKGAKLGQILLGSQIALLVPANKITKRKTQNDKTPFQNTAIKPVVKIGARVSAGETILFTG